MVQSVHYETGINPDRPTLVTPFEATLRVRASVPAITFGDLTHASSANTVWDVRVGRFAYNQQDSSPSTVNRTTPSRIDRVTGVTSGAPGQIGEVNNIRTTAKATISHYRVGSGASITSGRPAGKSNRASIMRSGSFRPV